MNKLLACRKNVYSQNGEDGLLSNILSRLKDISTKTFVEFGAWDGKKFSNTYNLVITDKEWKGLYIEADKDRFLELQKTCQEHKGQLLALQAVVDDNLNSLDNILPLFPQIPKDFDVLSIDIDSFDYQVWKACTKYRPKVVVIEINSAFEPGIVKIHQKDADPTGTSFTPMVILGESKGYKLLCHVGNLIFIREDLAHLFPEISDDPDSVYMPGHSYLRWMYE